MGLCRLASVVAVAERAVTPGLYVMNAKFLKFAGGTRSLDFEKNAEFQQK